MKRFFLLLLIVIYLIVLSSCDITQDTNETKQKDAITSQVEESSINKVSESSTVNSTKSNTADETIWYPRPHNCNSKDYNKDVNYVDSSYIDPLSGWMLKKIDSEDYYNAVEIYRTSDGGKTWNKIADTDQSLKEPKFKGILPNNKIPYFGVKAGISFLDSSTGWITGNLNGGLSKINKVWMYATHDSGYTWEIQDIPVPPLPDVILKKYFPTTGAFTYSPWFFTPTDGILMVGFERGDSKFNYLYFTHDGGNSWGDIQQVADGIKTEGISGNITWDFSKYDKFKVSINGNTLIYNVPERIWELVK